MKTKNHILLLTLVVLWLLTLKGYSQSKTDLKQLFAKNSGTYIPDFSYAGYQYGEKPIPNPQATIVNATDFGVIANDNLDDSKGLLKAIESCKSLAGNVVLQLHGRQRSGQADNGRFRVFPQQGEALQR